MTDIPSADSAQASGRRRRPKAEQLPPRVTPDRQAESESGRPEPAPTQRLLGRPGSIRKNHADVLLRYDRLSIRVLDLAGPESDRADPLFEQVIDAIHQASAEIRKILNTDPANDRNLGSFGLVNYGPDLAPELQVDFNTLVAQNHRALLAWQARAVAEKVGQAIPQEGNPIEADPAIERPVPPTASPRPRRRRQSTGGGRQ